MISISLSLLVTSCSKEEDESILELTKYKWYSEDYDLLVYGKDGLNASLQTDRIWIYFLSNGTGIMSCRTTDKDTYFGTSRDEIAFRFNYTVSGSKVRLSFKDSSLNRSLTYSKDYLVDSENSTAYKALSFTSSELDHAKGLADEQEFQASINHNQIQSLDVFIGFGNYFPPIKDLSDYYLWSVSSSCLMPMDSYRRGITSAGLVVYIDNGTITNKTGYDRESECNVKVTTLDGKNAYYFEHVVYSDKATQCGASIDVDSKSGTSLTIHRAYRYYDSVSKKYFTSPSKEFVLTGEGIDVSGGGNAGGATTGTNNGHEWVDLGLSVKWATCNLGADSPETFGNYFAWGETTGYTNFSTDNHWFYWKSYKWCDNSYNSMTKYCTSSEYGIVDNKTTLEPSDDAATVNWGGTWRMPTMDEFAELCNNCTWTWTTKNGVEGCNVRSKNGNHIFLPATKDRWQDGVHSTNHGKYWSSTVSTGYNMGSAYARSLYFSKSGTHSADGVDFRCMGMTIRAVCR